MASRDEHIIVCSICRRGLIVKDTINNGIASIAVGGGSRPQVSAASLLQ